jgi:hypothetical protein
MLLLEGMQRRDSTIGILIAKWSFSDANGIVAAAIIRRMHEAINDARKVLFLT